MKALVTERYLDWRQKLALLNLSCAEITGDTEHDDLMVIKNSEVCRPGWAYSFGFLFLRRKR